KGKAELVKDGEKIAILSCGSMFETSMAVAEMLEKDGHNPMVYNARFVKPMDIEMIRNACEKCEYIFTVEDGIRNGGFGSLVSGEIENLGLKKRVFSFAFDDKFVEHGTREQLFERYGLDADGIYNTVKSIID
ncbi:MAG: 1-deoxy-D-xylulose-5-phosphate synthase, partial [Firmicutes bacterium]|nr:1-deoxy-D-xylulose-5-phosphate synthase [Bacillota bacterium]